NQLVAEYPDTKILPKWKITKGEEFVRLAEDGTLEALEPGEVMLQGTIPGLAADKGFLFIDALGRVGAFDEDGTIHWDIVGMILTFGISLYINQLLSGQNANQNANDDAARQQATVNKITPVLFSGMFFFFPLPAGVLMYMLIANIFQTAQTFLLMREPLPENIQKMLEQQEKAAKAGEKREALPFEPKGSKKVEKPEKEAKSGEKREAERSKKTETAEKEAKSGEKRETMPFEPKRPKKKASS
ncbi:MAG: hypothetical protein LDL41_07820, partial [Coleofasciculus sp. S288]|nr:hypothetical protein [Coleofasciculus sp. S288]